MSIKKDEWRYTNPIVFVYVWFLAEIQSQAKKHHTDDLDDKSGQRHGQWHVVIVIEEAISIF